MERSMRFSDYEQLHFERRSNGVLLITLDRSAYPTMGS